MIRGVQFGKYIANIKAARFCEFFIAGWYWMRHGLRVDLPAPREAKNEEEALNFVDQGDFFAALPGPPGTPREELDWKRMDVKHVSADFTGPDDFPYERFFIMNKNAWDRAEVKPHRVVIVNKAMTHAGVIDGNSKRGWEFAWVKNRTYGTAEPVYYVKDRSKINWVEL